MQFVHFLHMISMPCVFRAEHELELVNSTRSVGVGFPLHIRLIRGRKSYVTFNDFFFSFFVLFFSPLIGSVCFGGESFLSRFRNKSLETFALGESFLRTFVEEDSTIFFFAADKRQKNS